MKTGILTYFTSNMYEMQFIRINTYIIRIVIIRSNMRRVKLNDSSLFRIHNIFFSIAITLLKMIRKGEQKCIEACSLS